MYELVRIETRDDNIFIEFEDQYGLYHIAVNKDMPTKDLQGFLQVLIQSIKIRETFQGV